jgi:nucleotide-binding universal stress UspA family protein
VKILVAADGSEYTRRMIEYIAAHDDGFAAKHEYDVLHVVEPLPHRAAAFADMAYVHRLYEQGAQTVLRPVGTSFEGRGIAVRLEWTLGRVAETLAKRADEGRYDLVVMGSHGHGRLMNVVLGSVTTEVLARCRTPVLVVR